MKTWDRWQWFAFLVSLYIALSGALMLAQSFELTRLELRLHELEQKFPPARKLPAPSSSITVEVH